MKTPQVGRFYDFIAWRLWGMFEKDGIGDYLRAVQ